MKRILLLSVVFLAACAHQPSPDRAAAKAALQDPDLVTERYQNELALNQVHQTDGRELALAKIALDHSQAFEVQQLAQSMRANHLELEKRVNRLARDEGVMLVNYEPTGTDKIAFQRLKDLNGKAFDEAIRWTLRDSQRRTGEQFRQLVLHSDEPGVVVMLADVLPKIRKQEEQAANVLSSFNEFDLSAQSQ